MTWGSDPAGRSGIEGEDVLSFASEHDVKVIIHSGVCPCLALAKGREEVL